MRKIGFTLAEILITLSIIGVVAALAAPTLINDASNAQIRPTIIKAVQTLENANLALINRDELNSLNDIANINNYISGIVSVMSGAVDIINQADINNANPPQNVTTDAIIHMKGNIDLNFIRRNNNDPNYNPQGGLRGPYYDLIIDIDGNNNGANHLANDQYRFVIDGSGTILPYGGRALSQAANIADWNSPNDETYSCNSIPMIGDGTGCAGSVMENTDIIFR